MNTRAYYNLYDNMIVEYLIITGMRKSVAYTDKKFLVKYDSREYREATPDEIREIITKIQDEHMKNLKYLM